MLIEEQVRSMRGYLNKKILPSARKKFWQMARITRTERLFDLLYHFVDAFIHRKKIVWCKADTIEQYCKDNNEVFVEIEARCSRLVYEPPFFEQSNGKQYQFPSPSIYVASLHDATVLSATGVVLAGEKILCDMIKMDQERRIKWPWGPVRRVEGDKVLLVVNKNVIEIERAINLCGFASNNYYHFTMEILSRLGYVNKLPDVENMPILIDEGIKIYPQLEELLHVVNQNREVIYVSGETCIKVHSLIQPSMNTWGALNVESWDLFKMSDNLTAQSGVANIRSCVNEYLSEQTTRKIFISRKNHSTTRLKNEAAIIPLFESAGFEIVYPESLSYVEQVRLFSTVKCVVGVTGAALTNILYCQPGTVVGCIIPKEYGFCIYSTLAELVGCRTLFLSPEIISRSECIIADGYQVEEEQCKRYIQELNRMCL